MSDQPKDPSRRRFFGTAASAAVVASVGTPPIEKAVTAATAAAPTSIAEQLEAAREAFKTMNAPMSPKMLEYSFDHFLDNLKQSIEKETGISYRSIESVMDITKELERNSPVDEEGLGSAIEPFRHINKKYVRSVIVLETLINEKDSELLNAARHATKRITAELEKIGAQNDSEYKKLLEMAHLSLPETLTTPDGSFKELVASANKKIQETTTKSLFIPATEEKKFELLKFIDEDTWMPINNENSNCLDLLPRTVESLKQSALLDITIYNLRGGLVDLRRSCPNGTLASLTLKPFEAGADKTTINPSASEQLDKDYDKVEAVREVQYKARACVYLLEHPIDIDDKHLTYTLHSNYVIGNASIDPMLPYDSKVLPIKAALIKKHPEFFVQGDVTPEQRSAMALDIGRAIKILSNAGSLAGLLAQMMRDDTIPTTTTETTEAATTPSQGRQLLLDYVRKAAPDGAVAIDDKTGAVEILDTRLKEEVAKEREALAREAAEADAPKAAADAPDKRVGDIKITGDLNPTKRLEEMGLGEGKDSIRL
jgi:hypothetical protein